MKALKKGHICFKRGHNFVLVTKIDNGRSVYGHLLCGRCGFEENYQYDYKD